MGYFLFWSNQGSSILKDDFRPKIFSGCDLYGFGAIFFGCLDMLIHGSASISRYRSIIHNRGRTHINSIFRKKLFPIKANEFFKFKVNRNQRNSMQSFWQWMCQWPSSLLRVRLKFWVWNVKPYCLRNTFLNILFRSTVWLGQIPYIRVRLHSGFPWQWPKSSKLCRLTSGYSIHHSSL